MQPKVALISGMNGFIGKNLAGILHERGWKVAGIPRQVLANPDALDKLVFDISPDCIFHLASYGNHHDQTKVSEIVTTNYLKTYFLLEAAVKSGIDKFINFSSSSVYGEKTEVMSEDDELETHSFYGATKVGAEYLCRAYAMGTQMKVANVRPFSVYGEGEAMHRFIPTMIDAIVNKKELDVYPDPVHDWIYIEDFVDGVMAVVDNIEKVNGQSINIGTGKQYRNKYLYESLVKISGNTPLETHFKKTQRKYDTNKTWQADNSKLRKLEWRQKYTIGQGLIKTYQYYKDMLSAPSIVIPSLDSAIEDSIRFAGAKWEDIPRVQ